MLLIELTNDEIRNSKAYKEYYTLATGEVVPKPKVSARRKRSGSDTSITPPTATTTPTTTVAITPRLTAAVKGKQPAKAKSPFNPSEVARTEAQQLKIVLRKSKQQTHISQLGGSDFVYQVEHMNQKKSNEMYYPRFNKVIIHHFMSKDPSIPRRNKINWHYVRDDSIFSMIKVVSRHQNTQQYDAMLLIELTNDEIRNSKAYKEYYTLATGEVVPKPKVSARRKRSGSDTSITPPTATTTPTTTVAITPRLTAAVKGKQPAKAKS
nr:hypothetical protein [Tanacetum cinerariifolium]